MKSTDTPLVSVNITAYNHEAFIEQAIQSVLQQKTDFDFEIILGEDDSKDNTRVVCQRLASKYPDKIKLLLNSRENVIYIDKQPTGRYNFINNLRNSSGKYIALLDGDDFWTSTDKLQKQVDLLEQNPNLSFCFHDLLMVDETGIDLEIEKLPMQMKKKLNLEELVQGIYPTPPLGSLMFHRKCLAQLPDWFNTILNGDIAIGIDGKMTAYRQHSAGVWSGRKNIYKAQKNIKMRKQIIHLFAPLGTEINQQIIVDNYLLILKESIKTSNIKTFFLGVKNLCTYINQNKSIFNYFIQRLFGKKNVQKI